MPYSTCYNAFSTWHSKWGFKLVIRMCYLLLQITCLLHWEWNLLRSYSTGAPRSSASCLPLPPYLHCSSLAPTSRHSDCLLSQHPRISFPTVRPLHWLFPWPGIFLNSAWLLSLWHSGLSLTMWHLHIQTQSKVASIRLPNSVLCIAFCKTKWHFFFS